MTWKFFILTLIFSPTLCLADVAVLVHGYKPSPGELDGISQELADRGYNVINFSYDWRKSLEDSADKFVDFVQQLSMAQTPNTRLVVFAHSMGGLVARRAMTQSRVKTLAETNLNIVLYTAATPFGGYTDYLKFMPLNIFGIQESLRYVTKRRDFIKNPGALGSNILHVKIETSNDTVTSLVHQENAVIDSDPRLSGIFRFPLGHASVLKDPSGSCPQEIKDLF